MIALFDVTDTTKHGPTICLARCKATPGIVGKLYVPFEYRGAVGSLSAGDSVFCVYDTAAGFGAVLFKIDDGIIDGDTMKVAHNADIAGTVTASKAKIDVANITTLHDAGGTASMTITPEGVGILAAAIAAVATGAPPAVDLPMVSLKFK